MTAAKPRSRVRLLETDTFSRDLFRPTGKIYRGNLHGHCTNSDGRNETAVVVRLYREASYDFTCLSDHYRTDPRYTAETVCDRSGLDSNDFITIISTELYCHGNLYYQAGLWYILANGPAPGFSHRKRDRNRP